MSEEIQSIEVENFGIRVPKGSKNQEWVDKLNELLLPFLQEGYVQTPVVDLDDKEETLNRIWDGAHRFGLVVLTPSFNSITGEYEPKALSFFIKGRK